MFFTPASIFHINQAFLKYDKVSQTNEIQQPNHNDFQNKIELVRI